MGPLFRASSAHARAASLVVGFAKEMSRMLHKYGVISLIIWHICAKVEHSCRACARTRVA